MFVLPSINMHKSRGIIKSAPYLLFISLFGYLPVSLCAAATPVNSSESQVLNHSCEEIGQSWYSSLASKEPIFGKDKWLGKSDPSSFSNPEDIRTESLSLRWKLDFDQKVITGSVVHDLVFVNPYAKELILDTRDIVVSKVVSLKNGRELSFKLGATVSSFGEPLTIQVADAIQVIQGAGSGKGNKLQVEIHYTTTENCTALQWLDPLQTAGKIHPYVYSQCEDTPLVKAKYNAHISVPKDLQALMSAVQVSSPQIDGNYKVYEFEQKIPIPSYLTAIVAGDIVGKEIGPRSKVWTEKEIVDAAAFEFSDTEKMVKAAENILGKYVWGQYDVLVLPPSFPYGGMENPCLTFTTPTLLAGDKSLANVIAHEISHSWTGNLVTNKDWQHFWLNEGFATFVERKILAALQGEEYSQFVSIGGWDKLEEAVKEMKEDNPFTRLVIDLNGIDPDDALSPVPYEKGYAFLYYLEQKVGGSSVFEPFLAEYVQNNSYKSIDSSVFIANFNCYFKSKGLGYKIADIDWDGWLYTPGMPLVKFEYDQTLRNACKNLKNRWLEWDSSTSIPFEKTDLDSMFSAQVQQFLQELIEDGGLPLVKVQAMDKVYNMTGRKNSEIRFRWIRLSIRSRSREIIQHALQFVNEQGRMRYVRPIYRDLYAWEEVRATAIKNYKDNVRFMMHVLAKMLRQDLHLDE